MTNTSDTWYCSNLLKKISLFFQALRLQAKLSGEQEPSKIQRLNSIPCVCDTNSSSNSSASAEKMVRKILRDMVDDAVNRVVLDSSATATSEQPPSVSSSASTASAAVVEIDCTQPEIRVSPAHRRTVEIDIVPAANTAPVQVSSSASSESRVVKMRRNTSEEAPPRGCTSAPIAFRWESCILIYFLSILRKSYVLTYFRLEAKKN